MISGSIFMVFGVKDLIFADFCWRQSENADVSKNFADQARNLYIFVNYKVIATDKPSVPLWAGQSRFRAMIKQ